MLRDLPPFHPQPDIEVFMTVPGTEDEVVQTSTPYVDPFDDVFGSTPSSPIQTAHQEGEINLTEPPTRSLRSADDPSDVPRLRSIHITNGYREGVAASKEKHVQEGFDEGYSLGAEIALKAGYILGALEGIYHALTTQRASTSSHAATGSNNSSPVEEMRRMLQEAEEALKVEKLFGRDYFGEDGVWTFDVPSQEDEVDVTFAKVAEAHPVIETWTVRLNELCQTYGLVSR